MSLITIGSKDLAISSAWLVKNIIVNYNQAIASIARRVQYDRNFFFGIRKICDEMIIDFRQKTNNGVPMNPSRTIRSITPHITILESGTGIRLNSNVRQNSGDGILPRNIRSFGLFDRGTSDFSNKSASWHGAEKNESENFGGNNIFENDERKDDFKVERAGCRNSVICYYKDSDSIHVIPNHSGSNQLIPDDLTNIG